MKNIILFKVVASFASIIDHLVRNSASSIIQCEFGLNAMKRRIVNRLMKQKELFGSSRKIEMGIKKILLILFLIHVW